MSSDRPLIASRRVTCCFTTALQLNDLETIPYRQVHSAWVTVIAN